MTHPVHLSSLAYTCGDQRRIDELPEAAAGELAALAEEIVHYRESRMDIADLAIAAAEQTLADSGVRPDLVLFVSENDIDPTGSLARITDRLGLGTVEHLAVAGHDCGNLAPVLRVAADALASGRSERVLLLLADRAPSGRRVLVSGLSVFSDGAAACLVTCEPVAGGPQVRVDGIATETAVRLSAGAAANQGILATVQLATGSITTLLTALDRERADFDHVVLPNYRPGAQAFLMAALGIPAHRLLLGPVTEIGHCFSADALITLRRHLDAGVLKPGHCLLAGTTGPHTWSTLALSCV